MAAPDLGILDYVSLFLYFAGIAGIGWWSSRRVVKASQSGGDAASTSYFLAERSVPWWAVTASLFASNIGAEHFVGQARPFVAPGLADLDQPVFAVDVQRQNAMGVPQLSALDDAGDFEIAVLCPAPAVMGGGGAGCECRGQDEGGEQTGHKARGELASMKRHETSPQGLAARYIKR